jgi:hypothetical protein
MKLLIEFNHPRGYVEEVQLDNGEIWVLDGECVRCGECCKELKCKHLRMEKVNGKIIATCTIMWDRPAKCMLYPNDPSIPLHDGCGYSWRKL